MSPPSSIIAALLLLTPLLSAAAATTGADLHTLLRRHGLPAGLFPKHVESFSVAPDTGLLEVHLSRPCYAKYEGMTYFDQVVRGNLSIGQLSGMEGLEQEELFLWLPVKGIVVSDPNSGVILFDIGLAHKQMAISLFEDPPECRPEEDNIRSFVGGGIRGRKIGVQEQ